ncbi:hypothetical protein QCB44_06920 [Thiomicrorhabdus sp. zzn3]|uniref:hypothetical protein n=1 Tax=Thiomicrorhabdus sp. zzn3 TaxID=3039775 RepID=UPI00243701EA|nr:hypothetical protein [Thiomicrorhabdus sp. zzn3]MDG6778430.1 hypothetical protein [Thiomicrorhabdus sp. zzn3]
MNKIYLIIIGLVFIVPNSLASDIGKALSRSEVSYLDLLANNLNMMTLMDMAIKHENDSENKIDSFTKYTVSKDHRLIIQNLYQVPVEMVTKEKCNELLGSLSQEIKGSDSDLTSTLRLIGAAMLTPQQASQVVKDAYIVAYVQAKENPQLGLNCTQ